jgi:hypothetical protein
MFGRTSRGSSSLSRTPQEVGGSDGGEQKKDVPVEDSLLRHSRLGWLHALVRKLQISKSLHTKIV